MMNAIKFLKDQVVQDNLATSIAGALYFNSEGGEWLIPYDGEEYLIEVNPDGLMVIDPSGDINEPLITIPWHILFKSLGYPNKPVVDPEIVKNYG